ncbi:MAG TPA: galactosyltransferase-related protein [Bacteroidales bacterium]|nr:galactosyltransferase-related protein [Bacteroidales bacterium]
MDHDLSFPIHPARKKRSQGISLITAVKNRSETLSGVIQTWVNKPEISEIIIVDWSSDHSLIPLIEKYQDDRILLAIVPGKPRWVLSEAFNLAARLSTKDKILKMDADVSINPDFFSLHTLKPGIFYSGNWTRGRDENERHLNGIVFLYAKDYFRVNGYNEYIQSYGWEDTDLYQRLEEAGLNRLDLNLETLSHRSHGHRTTFQDQTNFLENISDDERARINILINRYISSNFKKWPSGSGMAGFQTEVIGDHVIRCIPTGEMSCMVPREILEKAELTAMQERLGQLGFEINPDLLLHFTAGEIKALLYLFLSKDTDTGKRLLFGLIEKYNFHYSFSIRHRDEAFHQMNTELASKDYRIREQEDELSDLKQSRAKDETELWNQKALLKEQEAFIGAKDDLIRQKDQVISAQVEALHGKDRLLFEKEQTLVETTRSLAMGHQELFAKDEMIRSQREDLQVQHARVREMEQEVEQKELAIEMLNREIRSKEEKLTSTNILIREHEEQSVIQQHRIVELQDQLSRSRQELSNVYQSMSWRFGHFIFSLIGKLTFRNKK